MPLSILNKVEAWLAGLACGLVVLGSVGLGLFLRHYQHRFYPGILIDAVDVSGLTLAQAQAKLGSGSPSEDQVITVQVDNIAIASSSSQLGLHRTYDDALDSAMRFGKQGDLPSRLITILDTRLRPTHFASSLTFDQTAVQELVTTLATQVDTQSQAPFAQLRTSQNRNTLIINPGTPGRELDQPQTTDLVMAAVALVNDPIVIDSPVASTGATLSDDQVATAKTRAEHLVGKHVKLKALDQTIHLNDQLLISLLQLPEGVSSTKTEALVSDWQTDINRPPQNAVFEYDPTTLVVSTFEPSRDGLKINMDGSINKISDLIAALEQPNSTDVIEADLPLETTPPEVSLAQTNDLGITELIGLGESEYDHSIPSRVHNVALTTSKITNHIVKPGEEFSFNRALGDVSSETGFKPAYVIKNGQTVLGDGGGVCQVSTTLFRAVLDAGLQITKRRAHSYRVSYYELNSKPGVDATVYSGDVDLRFINDTGNYLLIHGEADSQNLYMKIELYGTSDGRTTEIVNHRTWDFRAAPPPVYIPDPTLPVGTTKQVDWAASGIRASFTNVIKDKNGEVIREDTYNSNYIPWSAKYLQGIQQ